MSQFIKFYFASSMLNMFPTLIDPSPGACDFFLYHHIGCVFLFRCVLEFRCGWLEWYPCGGLKHNLINCDIKLVFYSSIVLIFFLMYIEPCIIAIFDGKESNLMSQSIKFHFTSSMVNMFRTLIHPSSGA